MNRRRSRQSCREKGCLLSMSVSRRGTVSESDNRSSIAWPARNIHTSQHYAEHNYRGSPTPATRHRTAAPACAIETKTRPSDKKFHGRDTLSRRSGRASPPSDRSEMAHSPPACCPPRPAPPPSRPTQVPRECRPSTAPLKLFLSPHPPSPHSALAFSPVFFAANLVVLPPPSVRPLRHRLRQRRPRRPPMTSRSTRLQPIASQLGALARPPSATKRRPAARHCDVSLLIA